MDLHKILAELHDERRQVNDAILSLERLMQGPRSAKNVPTAASSQSLESGKRTRTVSPQARVKNTRLEQKVKAKTAGS